MLLLNLLDLRLRVTLARSSSMGDLACRTGCGPSGARVANPSPSSDVVGFFVGFEGRNRQRVVVVVGVPDLTLVVLSGGVELGSGAAVRRWSVGSGCVVALRLTSTLS